MYLSEYTTPRAVPQYSRAISPGKHCPLFGVGAVLRGIQNITLIYVGTQDCVYYARKETLAHQLSMQGKGTEGSRVLAVQLSDSDLIFGIRPQLETLLETEAKRESAKAIFLVTSCSVEVLSEDLQSVASAVQMRTGKRISLIPTENFKTFSYFQGMEAALASLTDGLQPRPLCRKTFAILGPRHPGAQQSEPVRFLLERGYTLHSILPFDTDIEKIQTLPSVEFTLVLDGTGLQTAQTISAHYGVPYIRFDEKLNLERIAAGWYKLAEMTGASLDAWIQKELAQIAALKQALSIPLQGKTFFYSQVILYPFETCLFLTELGMKPLVMFLGSVLDKTEESRRALEAMANPQLLQNASNTAIKAMLDQGAPDYFIGAVGQIIKGYPVTHVNFRTIPVEAGFAFYRQCLEQLLHSLKGEDLPK